MEIEDSAQNSVMATSHKLDAGYQTSNDACVIHNCSLEDEIKTMETLHAKEIATIKEQCSDLEKSLSLMRDEYERCEDYWAGKLDEERQLAEQEQRITDEKFSELMCKIREYEDLFADDHLRRTGKPADGRLETIEEQDGLENQVGFKLMHQLILQVIFVIFLFACIVLTKSSYHCLI